MIMRNEANERCVINFGDDDYKKYVGLDIVAFSWAHPGAMGSPGEVEIVTSDGRWYVTNYAWGTIAWENVCEVVPVLDQCDFGLVGDDTCPEGWTPVDLGMGNHLVLNDSIVGRFMELTQDVETRVEMYQRWGNAVDEILSVKK